MALPRPIWMLLGLLSGLVALSAGVTAVLALVQRPGAAWFLAWFEVVVLTAGVIGVLLARGRFRDGPAIALLCIAGCVAAGSFLGYLSAGRTLMGQSLTVYMLARVAAGGVFAAAAAADVLLRRPGLSVPLLMRGLLAGIPVLVAAAMAVRTSALASINALHPLAQFGVYIGAFVVLAAMTCASAHWIIRAFAIGVEAPGLAGPDGRGAARA
ncbi:MAG: hypothetical protein JNJ48_06375 [Phycisphaerae bacterium]|nr:hypothetical protein [Phycisphaerae bacterium]